MAPGFAIELLNRAVMMALLTSAPLLVTALVVGVLVSLVQALTQIQEQTLTFIPKLLAVAVVMLLSLPWMVRELVAYVDPDVQPPAQPRRMMAPGLLRADRHPGRAGLRAGERAGERALPGRPALVHGRCAQDRAQRGGGAAERGAAPRDCPICRRCRTTWSR